MERRDWVWFAVGVLALGGYVAANLLAFGLVTF